MRTKVVGSNLPVRRVLRSLARASFVTLTIVSLVASEFTGVTPVQAATYTTTWNTQTDYTNNKDAASGGSFATSTQLTNVDVTTTPGQAMLTLLASGSETENFTGVNGGNGTGYHIDTSNSTAAVSSEVLQRSPYVFQNITSYVSSYTQSYATKKIDSMVYDPDNTTLYLAGCRNGYGYGPSGGMVIGLNIVTHAVTDISSDFYFPYRCYNYGPHLRYDSSRKLLYFSDISFAASYSPASGVLTKIAIPNTGSDAINFTGQQAPFIVSTDSIYGSAVNPSTGKFYLLSNSNGNILSYDPATGATSTQAALSPSLGDLIADINNTINLLAYNPVNGLLYALQHGGSPSYLVSFNPSTGATSTVSSNTIGSYWSAAPVINTTTGGIYTYNLWSNNGFTYQNSDGTGFVAYNATLPALWGAITNYNESGVAYDASKQTVYVDGCLGNGFGCRADDGSSHYAMYDGTTWTDLTQYFSQGMGTTSVAYRIASAGNGEEFWGTYNGMLASSSALATQSAVSNTIATSTYGIKTATLTPTANAGTGSLTYYLSNDGGTTWEGPVTPGNSWTFANSANDGAHNRLSYKVILTGNATVSSIQFTYNFPPYSGIMTNLMTDAGSDVSWANLVTSATVPANTTLEYQTRGATEAQGQDAIFSQPWSDYLVASTTGTSTIAIKANGTNGAANPTYRYLEIQVTMISSDGTSKPVMNSVGLVYSVNAAPQFNSSYPGAGGSGAQASQISDSTNPNWGKVRIDYSVLDPDADTDTGSIDQITPSFEYRLNSSDSWHAISSTYLSANATTPQNVSQGAYNTYTAYWNAKSQIIGTFSSTTQIRVTANDLQAVHNLAYATTTAFTLDTTPPVVSSFKIDGTSSTSTLSIAATSDAAFKDYNLTNSSTGAADGLNASSGTFQAATSTTLAINTAWVLSSSTTATSSTVYFVVRDIYGNTATTSAVAPGAPNPFEIHDISDSTNNLFKLFVAWTPYTSVTGATFKQYELWRSTDGTNYSLFQTITNSTVNYYLDQTVASSTKYYYKARTIDTDGDSSLFTTVASAQPQGLGGSSLPPVISSVTISNVKNTSAQVSWTTNTLSNSLVSYGTSNAHGSTASSQSYVTSHSVYLTGLQPNTKYYVKVSSTDFFSNTANDDNAGASYTFTTNGGPVISNVTVNSINDKGATVFWNTDTSSDSQVYYSTSANMSGASQAGDSTLVATTTSSGTYSHSVTLSNLSAATTYYFYVTSTDGNANTTKSDNNGQNYSFLTTRDTTPPVISNIDTPVINSTTAVVVWQTDKLANSQVEYGTVASTSDGMYANTTTLDTTMTAYHVATLANLTKLTTYYYRVRSIDAAGNIAYSDEQTLTTPDVNTVVLGGHSSSASSNTASTTPVDTTPPNIQSTKVDPINAFDATANVSTDQPTRAIVAYGEISSSTPSAAYTMSAGDPTLGTSHVIKLSGLTPGSSYHFIVTAVNKNGYTAESSDQTFTAKYLAEDLADLSILSRAQDLQGKLEDIIQSALPSLSPPFMNTPTVSSTTEDSATITWGTNIKAYTVLDYAADDEYQQNHQTYPNEISDIKNATTTHTITLTNLKPSTTYHFSTHAFLFPQVVSKSADYTFSTKANPVTAQVIGVKSDSFQIGWVTDMKTTSAIEYTDNASGTTQTLNDAALVTQHFVSAENLQPGHTYIVKAYGFDQNGNRVGMDGTLTVTTSVDTTKPTITSLRIDSNLVPGRTDIVQSIVSWKTDKPSTSAVYYEEGAGEASAPLKNKIENDTGYVTDHVVILPSLKPSTIYRIQVSSTDQAGNTLLLPIRTIVTPQQSESIIDIIFKNFSSTFNFIH